jgi:endonuclease YncB( thermonuclease family)
VFKRRRGMIATLYPDPGQSALNKRGPLGAYTAVAGKDLGQLLVGAGYAKVRSGSDLLLSATYRAAQTKAMRAKAGLWKRCG